MMLLRADGGAGIGSGHVMRCLALAQAWHDAGGAVAFISAGLSGELRHRLAQEHMALLDLDQAPGGSQAAEATAAHAPRAGAEWVVADGYGFGAEYQRVIKEAGLKLLVLDDYGHAEYYYADIVLNQNRDADGSLYKACEPATRLLLGTTYALLRIDAEILCAEHWDTVILDEAQKIKNPDSQVARAAYRLQADFPMALTGTPVENRLEELWSQIHFTQRGLLGGRRDFNERYERPIGEGDAQVTARLRARIAPFVLRRLKQDVAPELPPRTDIVIHVELDPEEQRIYDAIRAATRDDVVHQLESGGSVLGALEALLRLRQASCHPALVPGQTARTSSKLTVLREMLEEIVAEDHKALVFSQWTSLLDLVEPELREAGLAFGRLDGRTRDRAGVIGSFQDENGPPVLLVSLTAGGVGINLTAADHVFILDPWWNPAVEDQAADRAHRIGQDRPVMVYRLVAQGSVEEKILALQEKKRELAEAALGGRERAAGVTRQDLLALLD